MGEQYSSDLEHRRESLIDYLVSNNGLAEHLGIIVEFLQNKYDFMEMLKHAKSLHGAESHNPNIDINSIVAGFNEKELCVISKYMHAVGDYAGGKVDFESVDTLASQLIRLIPIPDTIYAPAGSFPEDLARAREEV